MSPWKQKSRILVTCPKGVSEYLKKEIESLGFPILREIDTAVQTEGTLEDTMLLNLHLRTAQRVLYQLQTFKVISPGELYKKINSIPWETLIHDSGKSAYICVTSIAENPQINDSRFVNQKVKDAIVDRIRYKHSRRPDSGADKDKAVVHVYWKNDQVIAYLDTSGERLSLRGYRKIPLVAPMQEALAAAVIMSTGWHGNTAFVNPMCGSGTLAIEAALIALNRAPGLSRSNFGFMHIKDFPEEHWRDLRKKARDYSKNTLREKIIATDIDSFAIEAAVRNAKTAGVDHLIEFITCSFENTPIPPSKGMIILNPPYGERLEAKEVNHRRDSEKKETRAGKTLMVRKADSRNNQPSKTGAPRGLENIYQGIGDFFKNTGRTGNWRGYIFTGNLEMIKSVGLRTKRRLLFYNGDIECRLLEYELYADSKKIRKE